MEEEEALVSGICLELSIEHPTLLTYYNNDSFVNLSHGELKKVMGYLRHQRGITVPQRGNKPILAAVLKNILQQYAKNAMNSIKVGLHSGESEVTSNWTGSGTGSGTGSLSGYASLYMPLNARMMDGSTASVLPLPPSTLARTIPTIHTPPPPMNTTGLLSKNKVYSQSSSSSSSSSSSNAGHISRTKSLPTSRKRPATSSAEKTIKKPAMKPHQIQAFQFPPGISLYFHHSM